MSNDTSEIFIKNTVELILDDFYSWEINNFGDWLKRYDDTIEEILSIVESYYDKISREDYESIQDWEKVIMINSLALYMVELDINFIPEGKLRNEILYRFLQTIRAYNYVKKGLFKITGDQILISNTKNYEFIKQ